ncbi:hypothetical protein ACIA58_08415 [Kribbella sp. NPDC051586]
MLIVVAGLLSSVALAGVVVASRKQVWQLAARDARHVIERAGI